MDVLGMARATQASNAESHVSLIVSYSFLRFNLSILCQQRTAPPLFVTTPQETHPTGDQCLLSAPLSANCSQQS